ncbi:MAG: magnesium-translocating P-type ATPase [Actinomycetales bacterium]|nr:magnesium-translocating P-type ATPase [Actinomycetales bacterium]
MSALPPSGVSSPWACPREALLTALGTRPEGLSTAQVEARRPPASERLGGPARRSTVRVLAAQFANPISLVLVAATVISMALGDVLDGGIILAIIAASGLLGFWQEHRADRAVAELLASVQVWAYVRRDAVRTAVPLGEVVVGDVVELAAGDLVPADARLLESTDLLVDASALTGETFPVEKSAEATVPASAGIAARTNCVSLGSHVVSGRAVAVVTAVGRATEFGRVARAVGTAAVRTSFERGIGRFGWLLVRLVAVLTTAIFLVNWLLGRPVLDSLLFALSLAVGITPQMLPAIVALSLATGARRLAARRVVVKRLDAIEDLGALTVLCTDKTGTLTAGAAHLDAWIDADGRPSERVRDLAAANAAAQRGFVNPLDDAILAVAPSRAVALDEVPYDFQRKRLSVLVEVAGTDLLITKGAVASVLALCTTPPAGVAELAERHARRGDRVIALASRPRPREEGRLTRDDERELRLEGLLVFHDPPKPGAAEAVGTLHELGVDVRLITGDSVAAAQTAARAVGIPADRVLRGEQLRGLGPAQLAIAVREVTVFAEVEPIDKERIVAALRHGGETVGFLGDGVNDAPALHAADVGISVDTAVDVAKQAASVVLLDKGLDVVVDGVRLGRQTFANTLKYIRLTTSANFGNMLSLAVASVVLPFLPLLPRQILLLNFLSDIPAMAIASDAVDPEQERLPVRWRLGRIQLFMVVFGLISTVFDIATFAVLVLGFHATAGVFQGAWFVISTLTELAVLFSLRTARPIWASRPSRLLLGLSLGVAALTVALPFVPPVAMLLGIAPPSPVMALALGGVLLGYIAANELVKRPARRLLGVGRAVAQSTVNTSSATVVGVRSPRATRMRLDSHAQRSEADDIRGLEGK